MMSKEETKINREMSMLGKDQIPRIGASLSQSEPVRLMIVCNVPTMPDLNLTSACSDSEGEEEGETIETIHNMADLKVEDAVYVYPKLLPELEVEIFSRVPCFGYWKLPFLSRRFRQLLKSGEIFRVRRERGLVKPIVFLHSGGQTSWTMFDKYFENFRRLPEVPCEDFCFFSSDKETISVGTQVIVIGREVEGVVVWRYELENHKWFKGPSMITPRVMYGSASNGTDALFAGGIHIDGNIVTVLNTAEKYNADTKTWTVVHEMHKRRKFSSGCFLGSKFYVLGGRDENDIYLTCGESYDDATDSWELIPDMLKDMTFVSSQSPPLIAVVDDNLYSLEISLNELRVYDVNANAWKKLGVVPLRANAALGWGVAFKSIGDRLLVVGPSSSQPWCREIAYYTCRPSLDAEEQLWEELRDRCDSVQLHQFIHNCCVMFA